MDWTAPIDIYCERTATGLLNEPFNALSNIAFLLAAWWGYRSARCLGRLTFSNLVAILLAGMIGIGSLLFHTFANAWSELADVIPIWSFVAWMILSMVIAMTGGNMARTAATLATILAVVGLVFWLVSGLLLDAPGPGAEASSALNGSEQYAPALLALAIFALITRLKDHPSWRWLAAATGVFFLSLAFRTIDMKICQAVPAGSHFAWHLLNGLMIGLLLQVMIVHLTPAPRQSRPVTDP